MTTTNFEQNKSKMEKKKITSKTIDNFCNVFSKLAFFQLFKINQKLIKQNKKVFATN
jgi:hypothetical protein